MQWDHGVDLRCGVGVRSLEGDANGHVRRAHLSDGTTVDADVVLASLGSIRNTEWLEGAGLAAGFWGVGCDAGCRALDINGVVTDSIYVAGDIARAPHPLYDYQFLSMEHWDNAVLGAEVAAHNMVSLEADRRPHLLLPNFWSGQFGVNIKSVGVCSFGDEIVLHAGLRQGAPLRRRLRSPGPHRRRRHLRSRQVAGVLRGTDRALGSVPAPATGLRPAHRHDAGPGRLPGSHGRGARRRLDRP
jgi:NADPH-dependent 2,4-dienoyl-CoA reductase/sulfur reductase-like enzyme